MASGRKMSPKVANGERGKKKKKKKVYIKCMEMKICLSILIQPKLALHGTV